MNLGDHVLVKDTIQTLLYHTLSMVLFVMYLDDDVVLGALVDSRTLST
jgi:hypothetical protein